MQRKGKEGKDEHEEIAPMRAINPEWDFMGRTFYILGQANLALRVPERRESSLRAIAMRAHDRRAHETPFCQG